MKNLFLILTYTLSIMLTSSCHFKQNDNQKADKEFANKLSASEGKILGILNQSISLLDENKSISGTYAPEKELTLNEIGVRSNFRKTMKSNVYITKGTTFSKDLISSIIKTDILENFWEATKKNSPDFISWLYTYHISSNTMRIYPWVDMSAVVGASIKWSLVNFFEDYKKVEEYSKSAFCTRPYDDVGGTGTNLSCCRIYNPINKLQNVILSCADLSLKPLLDEYRSAKIKNGRVGQTFLLIESQAPAIAYKKQFMFSLSDGTKTYSDDLDKDLSKLRKIISLPLLNLNVYIGDEI